MFKCILKDTGRSSRSIHLTIAYELKCLWRMDLNLICFFRKTSLARECLRGGSPAAH
jgi:hypothetical protein